MAHRVACGPSRPPFFHFAMSPRCAPLIIATREMITVRPRAFLPRLGRKKCRTSSQQKKSAWCSRSHFETQNLVHAIVCACVCANSMRLYFPTHPFTIPKAKKLRGAKKKNHLHVYSVDLLYLGSLKAWEVGVFASVRQSPSPGPGIRQVRSIGVRRGLTRFVVARSRSRMSSNLVMAHIRSLWLERQERSAQTQSAWRSLT